MAITQQKKVLFKMNLPVTLYYDESQTNAVGDFKKVTIKIKEGLFKQKSFVIDIPANELKAIMDELKNNGTQYLELIK